MVVDEVVETETDLRLRHLQERRSRLGFLRVLELIETVALKLVHLVYHQWLLGQPRPPLLTSRLGLTVNSFHR